MDFTVDIKFFRREIIISCSAPANSMQDATFHLNFGGLDFQAVFQGSHPAIISVSHEDLLDLPEIPHLLKVTWAGGQVELPSDPLLLKIDIRNRAEFLSRIQSLRKRITDPEAVRFCARRLFVAKYGRVDTRAAAICALGYRIAESLDSQDTDILSFWSAVETFLAEIGSDDSLVRWITSVAIVCTYVAILQENASEVVRFLRKTLSYREHLEKLSLLHTNFSRADILLALIEMARGEREAAIILLVDVNKVFNIGAKSSWIDHPLKGRNQYSEIFAVLKSVRVATAIRKAAGVTEDRSDLVRLAFETSISSLSSITRALHETGHWHAVLHKVSGETHSFLGDTPPLSVRRRAGEPPYPTACSDSTSFSANSEHAESAIFRRDVDFLFSVISTDSVSNNNNILTSYEGQLESLMLIDQRLRDQGIYVWRHLLDLSRLRFRISYMALVAGDKSSACGLLLGSIVWAKQVLGNAVVEEDKDFEHAGHFVLCAQIAYLALNRYLEPSEIHVTEKSIGMEFQRLLARVFRDPDFSNRIISAFRVE